MTKLRDYQQTLRDGVYAAWNAGQRNVLAVAPTGAGKTVLFASILADHRGAAVAIAHRRELVSQMSLALAREGIRHRIIGSNDLQKVCASLHIQEVGRSYYDPSAFMACAGVDTLIRLPETDPIFAQTTLWIQDEAHHVLKSNKWGKACEMFPKARGLGVTATPLRADGKGLGRHADGLFDDMVVGPPMRELITRGYLTDYQILCPPNAVRLTSDDVGDSGEFKPSSVKRELAKAKITGNVVEHYIKYARGKLGVTFASDIDNAGELAQAYRAAGVTAEVVTGETPTLIRAQILRRFAAKEVQQLVNVDLFGEGFDLPAIECVSMARPTASYGLYVQQFGRALRLLPGKERALIFDHVGNLERHNGPPDKPRVWSLDRRERQPKGTPSDVIPVRVCVQCSQPYERFYQCCPYCGFFPEPASRSGPEFVDGDLMLLDESTLKRMRGEIDRIDGPPLYPQGLEPAAMGAIRRNHLERQQAQRDLRSALALWGGWQIHLGRCEPEAHRRFYLRYGIDILSAQVLGKNDAELLLSRVNDELHAAGVIDASANSGHTGGTATHPLEQK